MKRPLTTLFLLTSLDGKISTGGTDMRDFDLDLPNIGGVGEGLYQYYDIEATTDLWSLNTGRVMAKIGANTNPTPEKIPVSFVILDNTHLDANGVMYMSARAEKLILVTANKTHPAYSLSLDNLTLIDSEGKTLGDVLEELYSVYGCEKLTVQSGGTLNSQLLREGLIDFVDIVVAPLLVGGRDTPTLVDGESPTTLDDLERLTTLELLGAERLEHSYLRLTYKVRGHGC